MPGRVDKGADEQGTLSVIPVARNSDICAEGFTKSPLYFVVCSVQSRLFTWQLGPFAYSAVYEVVRTSCDLFDSS